MTIPAEGDIPGIVAAIQELTANIRSPDGMPYCSHLVEYMHTRTAGVPPEQVQLHDVVPKTYLAVLEMIGAFAEMQKRYSSTDPTD